METGKRKVKSAAYQMVDIVSPSCGHSDNPESWKKEVLEGRRKRVENFKEEADAKIDAQTDSEQMRPAGGLRAQADDNQKRVLEWHIDETPAGPGRCTATHNPEEPSPEETIAKSGTPRHVAKESINRPAEEPKANSEGVE